MLREGLPAGKKGMTRHCHVERVEFARIQTFKLGY